MNVTNLSMSWFSPPTQLNRIERAMQRACRITVAEAALHCRDTVTLDRIGQEQKGHDRAPPPCPVPLPFAEALSR